MRRCALWMAWIVLAAMGCGDDGSTNPDSGRPDSGRPGSDAGGVDGGGEVDAGDGVDAGEQTCHDCHGDETSNAPPLGVDGETETSTRAVGAHRSHIRAMASDWHRDVLCEDCHTVPSSPGDPGHDDGTVDLAFSALAMMDGATPMFDGATTTCSGVYCHGATRGGGTHTEPDWTVVDGSQVECGSCHSTPPPGAHHEGETECQDCHPTMSGPMTFAMPQRHIDGTVDVDVECNTCHGDMDSPAPPLDTRGNTATTERGVGAHRSHIRATPSDWHREVLCEDCHRVPEAYDDEGHLGSDLPAELTFSELAATGDADPMWDGATMTCSGVHCHGGGLDAGGSNVAPTWTRVGAGEAECGTCHAVPDGMGGGGDLGATHPAIVTCDTCHTNMMGTPGAWTFRDPALHINGIVNL